MRMLIAAAAFASSTCLPALAQSAVDPALRPVLERMAAYVARCGEQASAIVAVWVIPENGTVVRTRLKLRKFLDTITSNTALGPASRPSTLDLREIDSEADIDVT